MNMPKPLQDERKDIGAFVGGTISGGRRKKGTVVSREVLTLDADHIPAKADLWGDFTFLYDCAACVYSTHKHSPHAQRLRLVLPLSRPVSPDEYIAIGRRVAGDLDIEWFDHTGFEPERLMYWPSTSKDGVYVFEYQDGKWLDVDAVLAQYDDWTDISEYPVSVKVDRLIERGMSKQGEPTEKPGLVGAFCRCYDIHEAIEKFLPEVYQPVDGPDEGRRYTYKHGSTASGLVTYDDKFAYSHHSTDPAGGKLCNSFDLVRLHLFGLKDEDAEPGTAINALPSYAAMTEFVTKDGPVKALLGQERISLFDDGYDIGEDEDESALGEGSVDEEGNLVGVVEYDQNEGLLTFDSAFEPERRVDVGDEDVKWMEKLSMDKKGNYHSTVDNVLMILENDPRLKGVFAWDDFRKRECIMVSPPWRRKRKGYDVMTDADDSGVRHYLEKVYGITGQQKIQDALLLHIRKHSFHPVKSYLQGLMLPSVKPTVGNKGALKNEPTRNSNLKRRTIWDGTERIDTLFMDFFGVEDSEYVRQATRKFLVAAVARVLSPGVKFDTVITLVGSQGLGKSEIFARLGGEWYSDSFGGVGTKEAYELIQGFWIIELAELAGLKKAEVESVKHFISKRSDTFRGAYLKRTETFDRQCVFTATTNEVDGFLKDEQNRRWWPINIEDGEDGFERRTKSLWGGEDGKGDLSGEDVKQIWAEALERYLAGEKLVLEGEAIEQAKEQQTANKVGDERGGMIATYFDMPIPFEWEYMDMYKRKEYTGVWGDKFKIAGEGLINKIREAEGKERGFTPEEKEVVRNEAIEGVKHWCDQNGYEPIIVERAKICVLDILFDLMGFTRKDINNWNTREYHRMIRESVCRKGSKWVKAKNQLHFNGFGKQTAYIHIDRYDVEFD